MQIFPAIDLRGGQVVRLYQGDYDQMTVYGTDPCAVARAFLAAGARYLHVVDLDGARSGTAENFESIAALARQGGLFIEVGGGIRTRQRIEQYLELGVDRCILGTIAVKDFSFTKEMARHYGAHIAVGVDARDGAEQGTNLPLYEELVKIEGLSITASGGISGLEELRQLRDMGVDAAILGKALYTGRLDLETVLKEEGLC